MLGVKDMHDHIAHIEQHPGRVSQSLRCNAFNAGTAGLFQYAVHQRPAIDRGRGGRDDEVIRDYRQPLKVEYHQVFRLFCGEGL